MDNNASSPPQSLAWRVTVVALGLVVVIAATVLVVTLTSSPSLPVLAASYKCFPDQLIPQLKVGQRTTLSTSYGGFTASFHSTVQKAVPDNGPTVGVPFSGTLTMTQGGQHWTLPRPENTKGSTIDVMCVIAFSRGQYPGVMIEGWSGGANCCQVPVVYLFDRSRGRYDKVVDMSPDKYKDPHAFFASEGFIPKVAGNQVLLATADGNFDYAFACGGCSAEPIVLDSVDASGLTDVTLQHPSLVAADARSLWAYVQRSIRHPGQAYSRFGFIAPWVADECAIGRGASAWATVQRLQRQGLLSDALYHQEWPVSHGSFVSSLRAFLLRNDYCIGQI